MNTLLKDLSLSAIVAGFIAVLVGFASAVAIVFQAAQEAGANPAQVESWIWALGIGMGVTTFGLSWYYRRPIIIVWSTPGAALLASSLQGTGLSETTGTFLFVGLMIILLGVTGWFNRFSKLIPMPIAAAMLAGILLQFGIGIFTAVETDPLLIITMLVTYLVMKWLVPRYAIVMVLIVGTVFCLSNGSLSLSAIDMGFATPEWVTPSFSIASIIGIGVPLFIVTMASQNLPGVAILQSSGYSHQPISPIITTTGLCTMILAPFGGFTFNLAAITAAICTSDEAHHDPDKRYIAGLSAGVFNIIAGIFGATVVSLFAAFPVTMVAGLAGLALLSTIGASLHNALATATYRDAALMTFLVTASGVNMFHISSAFWGVVVGIIVVVLTRKGNN